LFESKLAQDLHGIAANLNSSAESRELRGLLVHGDVDANAPQGCRRGKAAHPGTDNGNRQGSRHRIMPANSATL
jgi:hypothetical protein